MDVATPGQPMVRRQQLPGSGGEVREDFSFRYRLGGQSFWVGGHYEFLPGTDG